MRVLSCVQRSARPSDQLLAFSKLSQCWLQPDTEKRRNTTAESDGILKGVSNTIPAGLRMEPQEDERQAARRRYRELLAQEQAIKQVKNCSTRAKHHFPQRWLLACCT